VFFSFCTTYMEEKWSNTKSWIDEAANVVFMHVDVQKTESLL